MVRSLASLPAGLIFIIAASTAPSALEAKSLAKPVTAPQDRLDILANLAIAGGPITRVTMTQHYSRFYLYVEHASRALTLVDVTDGRHPLIIANMDLPTNESGSVLAAAGDAALVSSEASSEATPATKTMSIVSFADPAHPQTVKQFANVTSTAMDNRRGLIFVANSEGLWILHRNPAEDPEVQERYAHDVLYNH
jgi:hypothetical protein